MNVLTLDRPAAALRRQVMTSTDSAWRTKVQVSVGSVALGAARALLAVINPPRVEQARLGLQAVSRASVGLYQREAAGRSVAPEQVMSDADRSMRQRGWTRVVGVIGKDETVLVYVPTRSESEDTVDVCVAVLRERELVLGCARMEADAIAGFVGPHLPAELGAARSRERWTAGR